MQGDSGEKGSVLFSVLETKVSSTKQAEIRAGGTFYEITKHNQKIQVAF